MDIVPYTAGRTDIKLKIADELMAMLNMNMPEMPTREWRMREGYERIKIVVGISERGPFPKTRRVCDLEEL